MPALRRRHQIRDRAAKGLWVAPWAVVVCVAAACANAPDVEDDPATTPAIAAAPDPEDAESAQDTTTPGSTRVAEASPPNPLGAGELGAEAPGGLGAEGASPSAADGQAPLDASDDASNDASDDASNDALNDAPNDASLDDDDPSLDDDASFNGSGDGDPEAGTIGRGHAELAPELQPLPRSRWIRHRRAPRETLTQIAHRYGVEPWQLREWNDLGPQDPLPNRRKRIRVRARRAPPPRERLEYTVQEGDTWWTIALRHGIDSRDLRAYNWPRKGKMQPGAMVQVWIDPVVYQWVASGPDPVPLDRAHAQRRGGVSIGAPADGILRNGLRVPDVEGIHLRLPKSAYGTSHAVEQLVLAITHFHERSDYPLPVELGSMSAPRGGRIGEHKSHQSGRDVDVRLLRRPEVSTWKQSKGSRVQWDAVWQLVLAFAEQDVMVIFLDYKAQRRLYRAAKAGGASDEQLAAMMQYPRGSRAARGLVRDSPGHDSHMHVRFGCGSFETECVP